MYPDDDDDIHLHLKKTRRGIYGYSINAEAKTEEQKKPKKAAIQAYLEVKGVLKINICWTRSKVLMTNLN